jgi:flagellar biosynthesis regulator FlbT
MAHDKAKIYEQAQEAIKANNLFFIEDIIAFIPCSKPTFYEFFPVNSNELNTLKGLLEDNKVVTKSAIRRKLFKSDKAAELLALYRLICTKEEHQLLNQQYIDHTTKGESIAPKIIFSNEPNDKHQV